MENKFTPGPWKARDYKDGQGGIWIDCDAWKGKRALGGTLATALATGTGVGDVVANANLIAAAPEMYEALKVAVECITKGNIDSYDTVILLEKTLDKAEGRTNAQMD